jgi:glycosyltransferase involved in cell wall biosynthesis
MTTPRTISLCLTSYRRLSMLMESFLNVAADDRISEIIITEDTADDSTWFFLAQQHFSVYPKVKVFRNEKNLGCYRNKREAISKASNEFVIIFDSDNILRPDYLDRIFERPWSKDTIFAPDFAKPHFDYRGFSGVTLTKENVKEYTEQKNFTAMINTMNYFVNRDEYLKIWEDHPEPWTADTLFMNYNWLKAGNKIHVLKDLQYEHRIEHSEHKSHYQEHNRKTGKLFDQVIGKMRALK